MPSSAQSASRRLMVVGMAGLGGVGAGRGGHRIVAAFMERMAARQAPQRQRTAAQAAVRAHRLERVLRARGVEAAARAEQRADPKLIGADQDADELTHVADIFCQSFSRAERRRGLSARFTPARTPITMSRAGRRS